MEVEVVEFKKAIHMLKKRLSSDEFSTEIITRGLKCRELNAPLHLKLKPSSGNLIETGNFKTNLKYVQREFEWYFSGRNDTAYISSVAPFWNSISNNGISNSAYGQWAFGQNQFERVIEELKKDPSSRRAVIYFGSNENYFDKDVICTNTLQFTIRNGKLNCHVNMRSNDFYLGFRNDTIMFMGFQELAALRLNVPIGDYYLHATSFHIYEKDYDKLKITDFKCRKLSFIELLSKCKDDEMFNKIVEVTNLKDSKIIIDGADEVGKSTFVNKIGEAQHIKYGFGGSFEYFKQLMGDDTFICDRGIISEIVYSNIFDRIRDVGLKNSKDLLQGVGHYVFIPNDEEKYLEFLKIKHKGDKKIIDNASEILKLFSFYASLFNATIVEVNIDDYINDM